MPVPDHLAPLLDLQIAYERADLACHDAARRTPAALGFLRDTQMRLLKELLAARAAAGVTRHDDVRVLKREALAALWFEDTPEPAEPADPGTLHKTLRADLDGVRLPDAYTRLLYLRNGGLPRHRHLTTPDGALEVGPLLGVGPGAPEPGAQLRRDPDGHTRIAVFAAAPGGGEVLLDYGRDLADPEPAVVFDDPDHGLRRVADSFAEFVDQLRPIE
ncbi:SMI1/KNR4 family protein [Streptodolium elevatio]